ncbi:MAG TPA: phosphate ABC transporter ATP-binding protein PstB [Candidatus Limnocylindrales bacterium]|nr:phosphate ABC transporter ATP-binding protein PstB [Candidatus Limnocylindrales bacterium]
MDSSVRVAPAPRLGDPSTADETPVKLRAKDLTFFYGSFLALKDITLEIRANRVTAIIGPSGCGKSTLLQTFNRMYDLVPGAKARGSIRLNTEEVTTTPRIYDLRRRIGMVFQRPNPFPMSIYDNVAFGPRLLGWPAERIAKGVADSLRITGLWDEVSDRLHRSAASLSGGQQQRLCIARCLAVGPEVILMDEPCSALDPISTLRIEELIRKLRDRYTIVIVTHNMQQAKRVSDYTAFMLIEPFLRHGELIEFDRTDAIFNHPSDPRTRDYVDGKFG